MFLFLFVWYVIIRIPVPVKGHSSNILRCHSNVRHDRRTTKQVQQQEITSLNAQCKQQLPASLYNGISNICSKTWETTLKSKQNNVFGTRLQTFQSAHETINLFRCEKKHHEKQVTSFSYLQALGVENDTMLNGGVQKLKWSNNYHKNETESHQSYFWKVAGFLGKVNKSRTHRVCRFCKNANEKSPGVENDALVNLVLTYTKPYNDECSYKTIRRCIYQTEGETPEKWLVVACADNRWTRHLMQ